MRRREEKERGEREREKRGERERGEREGEGEGGGERRERKHHRPLICTEASFEMAVIGMLSRATDCSALQV